MKHGKQKLTALFSILSLILLCLGLAACGTITYKVTLDYNADQGTVALSPQAENNEYEYGDKVTVTVTANDGYEIETFAVSTDANASLTDGTYELTVSANTNVKVTFKATEPVVEKYSITKNAPENGEIEISPAAGEDGKYDENTEITVTLKPAQGYEVDTFTVGGADKKGDLNENVYKFNLSADTEINATFKASEPVVEKYSITKNAPENGEIEISPAAGEDGKYDENTEITVTLKPAQGYEVDTFTVGGADKKGDLNENVYKFNLSADTEINATFKAKQFSVTTTFEAGQGSITLSPEPTNGKYAYGTTVTVTVTAEENYEIETFTVSTDAQAALDGEGKYTLTVTADAAISATFKAKVVEVQSISLDAQTLLLEAGREDKKGATLTATVTPENATTNAVTWSVSSEGYVEISANENVLTITPVSAGACIIYAKIGEKQAQCTVSISEHEHAFTSTEQKDDEQHYNVCECTYKEAVDHTKELKSRDESVHGYACEACGWEATETEQHSLTPYADNSNVYHWQRCTCGYSIQEAHTYDENGSKDYKDGIKTDEHSHWVECYVCHMHKFEQPHTLTIITKLEDGNGKHKVTCSGSFSEFVEGNKCPYDEEVDCEGTELVPGTDEDSGCHYTKCKDCEALFNKQAHDGNKGLFYDENDADNHYTICDCGAHYNPQPHKAEENGKCACGKEMAAHTHQPVADENGYYDGSCSCGDNIFFEVDASGNLTKFSADATYKKIKVPESVNGTAVNNIVSVFKNNTSIESIIIPESVSKWNQAFYGCTNLKNAIILGQFTSIAANTFTACTSLEWIVLPASVTEINKNAFGTSNTYKEMPNFKTVYFLGTKADWESKVTVAIGGKATAVMAQVTVLGFNADGGNSDEWHWDVDKVTPKSWKEE